MNFMMNDGILMGATAFTGLIIIVIGVYSNTGTKSSKNFEDSNGKVSTEDEDVVVRGGVEVSFEGLKMIMTNKKKKKIPTTAVRKEDVGGLSSPLSDPSKTIILDGSIRGCAKPGRLLGIVGPSGAGKSSLLHALAGKIRHDKKLELYGRRYLNGMPVAGNATLPSTAIVEQQVHFFSYMTVYETLQFRVELQLGNTCTASTRESIVQQRLQEMGLESVADTVVGDDAKIRGISGGERKRLSVAVEMISPHETSILLLDEPTSGLDSTAASTLVRRLRALADHNNTTVVAVIHQPSQHVFRQFDDILVLAEGKQVYFGPRHDVRSYMDKYGRKAMDNEIGTAEHILDCVTRAPMDPEETIEQANERIARLHQQATKSVIELNLTSTKPGQQAVNGRSIAIGLNGYLRSNSLVYERQQSSFLIQFRLLLKRSVNEVTRGRRALVFKLIQQVTFAVVYGAIFRLGNNQASIQDRFGLLSLIVIGSGNMGLIQTVRSFPKERSLVSYEISSKMYQTLPYLIGKALAEAPLGSFMNICFGTLVYFLTGLSYGPPAGKFGRFLVLLVMHGLASQACGLAIGAMSPTSEISLAIFPLIMVLNIVFDGKNLSEENTPIYLRWIHAVGTIRWAFEGMVRNEFEGLEFETADTGTVAVANGSDALERMGWGSSGLRRTWIDVVRVQILLTSFFWVLSYVGLKFTRQKFLIMKEPPAE